MGWPERLADPRDPLRFWLELAREWHVPPEVVLEERTVNTTEWTARDIAYMAALKAYEASLCPGGDHVLAETSKPEHEDAYRPDSANKLRCYHCKAQHTLSEVMAKDEDSAGVFVPLMLDPDVVALNRLPVPEFPTDEELEIRAQEDAERQNQASI